LDGESSAFQELMPLVYPHLREVAAAYIRRERNPDRCHRRTAPRQVGTATMGRQEGCGY
jgi:hypothetical protein